MLHIPVIMFDGFICWWLMPWFLGYGWGGSILGFVAPFALHVWCLGCLDLLSWVWVGFCCLRWFKVTCWHGVFAFTVSVCCNGESLFLVGLLIIRYLCNFGLLFACLVWGLVILFVVRCLVCAVNGVCLSAFILGLGRFAPLWMWFAAWFVWFDGFLFEWLARLFWWIDCFGRIILGRSSSDVFVVWAVCWLYLEFAVLLVFCCFGFVFVYF